MGIAAYEDLGNSNVTNDTFRPQETSSFCGRLFSTISRNTSYIAQSVNSIAQLILSKCIHIGSLGRYTLDDLKSYFFSERARLKNTPSDEGIEDSQSNKSSEQLNTTTRQSQVGSTSAAAPPPDSLQNTRRSLKKTKKNDQGVKPVEKKNPLVFLNVLHKKNKEPKKPD